MASTTALKFYKFANSSSEGFSTAKAVDGAIIYLVEAQELWLGKQGATPGQLVLKGANDVTFNNGILTVTNYDAAGETDTKTLDFSDVASASATLNVFAHINDLIGTTTSEGTTILNYSGTNYLSGKTSLVEADKALDTQIKSINDEIDAMDATNIQSMTKDTDASGNVTLTFKGTSETDGKIEQGTGSDTLELKKVATTGKAEDVTTAEIKGVDESTRLYGAGDVQGTLTSIARDLAAAKAGSVDGVEINDVSVVTNNIAEIAVEGTYNASTNKIATQSTVAKAIDALDKASSTVNGTNVHVAYKEENGIVTVESVTEDYATIGTSKSGSANTTLDVTDGTKLVTGSDIATVGGFVNTRIAEEVDKLDVDSLAQASYDGTGNITINNIKEVDGKIETDTNTVTTINVDHAYTSSNATNIATVATVTSAINGLNVPEYAQAVISNKSVATEEGGSIAVKGIKEENGKIVEGSSVTLTAGAGLNIYENKIRHTNDVTAQTTGLGSSVNNATKIITGLTYDAQGHITAAGETDLVAANIANAAIDGLTSTNVQATMAEIEGQIKAMSAGMIYRGGKKASEIAGLSGAKVGDTYTITEAGDITIGSETKHAEVGDTVIIATVGSDTKPASVVVVERNLEGAVTNTGTDGTTHTALTSDKLVLGNGNDTVKTSTYGVSATAITVEGAGNDTDILTSKAVVDTIANKISNLDATVTSDTTNVNVSVTETDGKLTAITVSEDYATVTYAEGSAGTDSTITVTDGGQLVKGSDIENVVTFTNKRIDEEIAKLDATPSQAAAAGNGMLALSLTEVDGKVTAISGSVAASDGTAQLNLNGTAVTLATIAGITIDAQLDTLATVTAGTAGGVQLTETGNVLSASLIDNAVTTAKIKDGNVTFDKIATANIQDGDTASTLLTTKSYVDEQVGTAVKSVTGESGKVTTEADYAEVEVDAETSADNKVTLTSKVELTMQAVSTADASNMGLAEASDVKSYVDGQIDSLDATVTAGTIQSGVASNVNVQVVQTDGKLTSVTAQLVWEEWA